MMYARSIASSVGLVGARSADERLGLRDRDALGERRGRDLLAFDVRITARSSAFSSSRTLPGQP